MLAAGMMGLVPVVASSPMLAFFASYFLARKDSPEAVEATKQLYSDMHRPVDFEKEVSPANDHEQLLLLGARLTRPLK